MKSLIKCPQTHITSAVSAAIAVAISAACLPSLAVAPTLTWDQLNSGGTVAFEACQYGKAERMLYAAVAASQSFPPSDIRRAKCAGELGRLLTVRGRFAEAEAYLEEELRVKEQAIGNENGELIQPMCSLVRFYLTGGTASKADPLTEDVLAFVDGSLKETNKPQTTTTIKKGMPLQAWAGAAASTARDPLIEWAIACDDIGHLYLAKDNFEMAERLFKAALNVKSTVLGNQHLSLANSYDNLGSLCLARNDIEGAESYFSNALEITEKIQPPSNPEVFSRLDKLAKCLTKEGKDQQAEALYLRAQDFWKNERSRNGNDARARFALGNLYVDEKNYTAAAPILEQALQMSEEYNGPLSVQLVPYLQRYAYTLYYLGRKDECDALRARSDELSATAVAHKDIPPVQ